MSAVSGAEDQVDAAATQRQHGDYNNSDVSDATDDFCLVVTGQTIRVQSSLPVPDSVSSAGSSQHPFCTFTIAQDKAPKTLQWQIEPLETGPLRYTLVHVEAPKPENVRAIYHHIGQAPSLSLCDGQGVLLLPSDGSDPAEEAVTVASLLGLLWRVRGLQVKPAPTITKAGKKSILQRLF